MLPPLQVTSPWRREEPLEWSGSTTVTGSMGSELRGSSVGLRALWCCYKLALVLFVFKVGLSRWRGATEGSVSGGVLK